MNSLERVVLDQHARVRAAGADPLKALEQAKGEILAAADKENTADILTRGRIGSIYPTEPASSRGYMRRAHHREFLISLANGALDHLIDLEKSPGIIVPSQGYLGGIAMEHGKAIGVFGFAPRLDRPFEDEDPIQLAMGDVFYPPMMWAKALRVEAYNNRPESMKDLTISQYLAAIGSSLGSASAKYHDVILGATGFMPGETTANAANAPWPIGEHIMSEEVEAFRLSGFCDQAVVDPEFMKNPSGSMFKVIHLGGSLN